MFCSASVRHASQPTHAPACAAARVHQAAAVVSISSSSAGGREDRLIIMLLHSRELDYVARCAGCRHRGARRQPARQVGCVFLAVFSRSDALKCVYDTERAMQRRDINAGAAETALLRAPPSGGLPLRSSLELTAKNSHLPRNVESGAAAPRGHGAGRLHSGRFRRHAASARRPSSHSWQIALPRAHTGARQRSLQSAPLHLPAGSIERRPHIMNACLPISIKQGTHHERALQMTLTRPINMECSSE